MISGSRKTGAFCRFRPRTTQSGRITEVARSPVKLSWMEEKADEEQDSLDPSS